MYGKKRSCLAKAMITGEEVGCITLQPLFNSVKLEGGWSDEGCSILVHVTDKYGTLNSLFSPKELQNTFKASKDDSRRIIDGWPRHGFLAVRRSSIEPAKLKIELVVGSENDREKRLTYVEGSFKRRDLMAILRDMNKWFEQEKAKALKSTS